MDDSDENERAEIVDGDYFMDGTYGEAQGEVNCEMEWRGGVGGGADSNSDLDDGIPAEPEWEPPMPDPAGDWPQAQENEVADEDHDHDARLQVQEHTQGHHGYVAIPYPDSRAGQEINQHGGNDAANARYSFQLDDKDNIYFPFCSQTEWEIARWAKLRGPSSTAFTDLLAIDGVSSNKFVEEPLQ
ncbi:hypothetical protein EV702DRAFT_1206159 [Suillus placidus]|uniref:Uncharacterized protein n=1 Tax=Suillus placidus TaxID=48579 RepID=A0A9P6ZG23_9AGAM|nr:hypothetical protein EV702DRAFT_1206159 [Suillus placidus]